ncbi:outer membrane protein assembly factor BamE [Roseateles sp. BYS180W]|uniref:Outer membrane protein assembly factor BamE n=1 Tax=Roseateles rivi TaxID=3299028 RepID=A0ABW7FUE5_9BURK
MTLTSHKQALARWALALATLATLGGCMSTPELRTVENDDPNAKVLGLVRPYRVEIVQGNVLTRDMLAKVKPGMHREQVRDLLGSPLLADIFHADRWDYVFSIRRQGAEPQRRQVSLHFEKDLLKSVDAPKDLPTENEFIASINTRKAKGEAPKLELSEAERKALPVPVRPPATPQEPVGATRTYPPLEGKQ